MKKQSQPTDVQLETILSELPRTEAQIGFTERVMRRLPAGAAPVPKRLIPRLNLPGWALPAAAVLSLLFAFWLGFSFTGTDASGDAMASDGALEAREDMAPSNRVPGGAVRPAGAGVAPGALPDRVFSASAEVESVRAEYESLRRELEFLERMREQPPVQVVPSADGLTDYYVVVGSPQN